MDESSKTSVRQEQSIKIAGCHFVQIGAGTERTSACSRQDDYPDVRIRFAHLNSACETLGDLPIDRVMNVWPVYRHK
jgi:hypothetical protein